MNRREPCVCGRSLIADDASPESIVEAVQLHNRTPQHVAWRLGMHLETTTHPRRPAQRVTRVVAA